MTIHWKEGNPEAKLERRLCQSDPFGLLQRVAVSADEWPCEDDVAGMAAWGLVYGLFDGLVPQTCAKEV